MGNPSKGQGITNQQVTIRKPTLCEVLDFHHYLREEDLREIRDVGGMTPQQSLVESWQVSKDNCFVAEHKDNGWICIWGCGPSETIGVGYPWLMATPEIENIPMTFLRESKRWLEDVHKVYPIMTNVADERNGVHLKWLKWLGFSFVNRYQNFGPGKVSVVQFARVSSCAMRSL